MNCKQLKLMITLVFFAIAVFGCSTGIQIRRGEQLPGGWFVAGDHPEDYEMGVDSTVTRSGNASGYIKSNASKPKGFGTLMQTFKADDYRGERLRMSGYIKAEKVKDRVALWMRVDGPEHETLRMDTMKDRPIVGTAEWEKYEIVLDVPENSVSISFGILLGGKGQAWVDDLQFEVVGKDVPTTDLMKEQPLHLDFED